MNKNERLSIDLKINLDILEELYYSNITKRGLYKVYNQEIGSYYALKVYDVNMNDVQDIEKEIISYNRNANIINFPKIHYKFKHNDLVCIIMDWIDGKTATNNFKIKPKDSFDIKHRINYCLEICIIDFGLSALKRNLNGEGTPIFQSPEQDLAIGAIDIRTDIYALGLGMDY